MDIFEEKGTDIEHQAFTWRDLAPVPISKLDSDAFTRVRVILMAAIESEQNRFLHAMARNVRALRPHAARIRRIEHHQQTLVNWLLPADQTPLETTIGLEQAAIEVTAAVALLEPDPYLAEVYRFGMVEDFDHLYRFSALMDRLQGKDANALLHAYTDIMPGRPTTREHRASSDDLREPYHATSAELISKLHALTITAGENQARDYYMAIGPQFADPLARQLYAEIASIEEQHVTQYESLIDPDETWLEKWLLHEANEVWNYWSCMTCEDDLRVRRVWERFCDYELGQLHHVMELFKQLERRDPAEVLPQTLPGPMEHREHRAFVRSVLEQEGHFTACGPRIGPFEETPETAAYRARVNADGSPSEIVAAGYRWAPGTELLKTAQDIHQRRLGERDGA